MNKTFTYLLSPLAMLSFAACDDTTDTLGIYSSGDVITNSTEVFNVTTRSLKLDSVVANSSKNYLGCVTDLETGTDITADFAAQFYCFEDYNLPLRENMVGDVDGVPTKGIVQCDSCEVRLFFDSYYGDENNPMKLHVYELDRSNILSEDSTYYTDVDLRQYLPANATPLASRVFTPKDYNESETTLSGSSYDNNVRIVLPRELGQRLLEHYYANSDDFANSHRFIRNVFPGLYFRTSGGKGTMLSVYVGTMNIFYRYYDAEQDTTYEALTRFAATPEVIQSTHFDNENVDTLIANPTCTYLKTPAGICTEMTFPIDDLFAGQHATDSISKATITLVRYNKSQDDKQFGTPSELLMVRKRDMYRFFRKRSVADGRTSYTTSFNSTYNSYTFNNISRLLAYCKQEKMAGAKEMGISEDDWAQLPENRDWNKVVLIPVVTSTNSSSTATGSQQVSVGHDLSLGSIRLVGGNTQLKMQVVYSKFSQ